MKKYQNPAITIAYFKTENICTLSSAETQAIVEAKAFLTSDNAKVEGGNIFSFTF